MMKQCQFCYKEKGRMFFQKDNSKYCNDCFKSGLTPGGIVVGKIQIIPILAVHGIKIKESDCVPLQNKI